MRNHPRRATTLTAAGLVALAVSVTGAARPALAGGPFEPIVGDVTGDRVPDVVVLTAAPAARSAAAVTLLCQAQVRPGLPGGGEGPPRTYTYLTLPSDQPCPDMGTAADVNGRGIDELMLTWFGGPPPVVPDSMLTVQDFRVVAVTNAQQLPSYVDNGNFNDDGLEDIYEWSDEGEGYATFLSNGDGTFRPGPEKWCATPRRLHIRDLNHNARQDALISYYDKCDDHSSGVVVTLDDGSSQVLQTDPTGERTWASSVVLANADRYPDVRTVEDGTGAVTYFVNTGSGRFVRAPVAVPDLATTRDTVPVTIPVLANDYVGPTATVGVVTPPRHGSVRVTATREIVYTPQPNQVTPDQFVYQVDEEGRSSRATVTVRLTGTG
jgi:hypothetical protein